MLARRIFAFYYGERITLKVNDLISIRRCWLSHRALPNSVSVYNLRSRHSRSSASHQEAVFNAIYRHLHWNQRDQGMAIITN